MHVLRARKFSVSDFFCGKIKTTSDDRQPTRNHVGTECVHRRLDPVGDFDIVRYMVAAPEAVGIPTNLVARTVRHENILGRNAVFMDHSDKTPQRYGLENNLRTRLNHFILL